MLLLLVVVQIQSLHLKNCVPFEECRTAINKTFVDKTRGIVDFSMRWYKNCILSSVGTAATFAITDTKFYVPVVNLKTEDNAKLSNLFSKGFKRSVHWNEYRLAIKDYDTSTNIREKLDASFQGFNELFVLAYAYGNNVTNENSYRTYFLPKRRKKITTLKFMEEIFMTHELMT